MSARAKTRRGGQCLHEARAHASVVRALVQGVEAVFSSGGDFLVRAWDREKDTHTLVYILDGVEEDLDLNPPVQV